MPASAIVWFLVGTLLPSAIVCWAFAFVVRRVARAWGLVDRPGGHKRHREPTPLGGGVAIWLGVVAPLAVGQTLLWLCMAAGAEEPGVQVFGVGVPEWVRLHLPGLAQQSGQLWILIAAGTILMLLGLGDDRWRLDWRLRLIVQVAVAAALVWWQDWRITLFIPSGGVTGVITVVWIVAIVNAVNMLDNMDGLSAGVTAIAAAVLAIVMLVAPDPETGGPQLFVAGFVLLLAGALAGFLWHNRAPARLFMGDAGAYLIGFWIAVATVLATFAGSRPESRHVVFAPLCVLAVPLYDLASVVWIRLRSGRSPFQADNSHFSHRLVQLGMTPRQAVWTIYLAAATCASGALLLHQVNRAGAWTIVAINVCVLGLIALLENAGRRCERGGRRP